MTVSWWEHMETQGCPAWGSGCDAGHRLWGALWERDHRDLQPQPSWDSAPRSLEHHPTERVSQHAASQGRNPSSREGSPNPPHRERAPLLSMPLPHKEEIPLPHKASPHREEPFTHHSTAPQFRFPLAHPAPTGTCSTVQPLAPKHGPVVPGDTWQSSAQAHGVTPQPTSNTQPEGSP